jgi:hypothetical protein
VRRTSAIAAALVLVYLLLGEVAWRSDFMAALGGARQGRPLLALVEVVFFGLRVVLLVAGPPLAALALSRAAWSRLTKS